MPSILPVDPSDIETFTVVTNPVRTYTSSSLHGATGSVHVFARRPDVLKDVQPDSSFTDSAHDDADLSSQLRQVQQAGKTARNSTNPVAMSSFNQMLSQYLLAVDQQGTARRLQQQVDVQRFTPPLVFNSNTLRKLVIKDTLNSFYRDVYPTAHWAYSNYSSLNFFTASNVPSDSVLLYPNIDGGEGLLVRHDGYADGTYVPSGAFSFDFYVNPRYQQDSSRAQFRAGTILHLSSTFALSLVSGSALDATGRTVGFRLQLQLSQSADIPPSWVSQDATGAIHVSGPSGSYSHVSSGSVPAATYVFLSDDNALQWNHWHHVVVRWGTSAVNAGSGTFNVDGIDRGSFVVPLQTIAPKAFGFSSGSFTSGSYSSGSYSSGSVVYAAGPFAFFQTSSFSFTGSYTNLTGTLPNTTAGSLLVGSLTGSYVPTALNVRSGTFFLPGTTTPVVSGTALFTGTLGSATGTFALTGTFVPSGAFLFSGTYAFSASGVFTPSGIFTPTGSFVPSGALQENPAVLCLGNYYEGANTLTNPQAAFFDLNPATRDGLIVMSDFGLETPQSYSFAHPLNAELHDVAIRRCYLSDDDIALSSSRGPTFLDNTFAFYVPPFFVEESPFRQFVGDHGGLLLTPFEEVDGATTMPFNVALSFGVGGHYINLENFAKDFASEVFPLLHHLTGVALVNSTGLQTCNQFLYAQPFVAKRNLTVMPCDDGGFVPSFQLLASETLQRAVDDLELEELSFINLDNMVQTASLLFGPGTFDDGSQPDSQLNAFANLQLGSVPESPFAAAGPALVGFMDSLVSGSADAETGAPLSVYQRTQDASSNELVVFDISNLFYGFRIQPGTLQLSDPALSGSTGRIGVTLADDGRGNVYRADCLTPQATWNSVGNLYYDEGLLLVKSPHLMFFGEAGYSLAFRGEQHVHVMKIDAFAPNNALNSSSNPTFVPVPPNGYPNDPEGEFVYVTNINFHDSDYNVVMKTALAQPLVKRPGDRVLFKVKYDF